MIIQHELGFFLIFLSLILFHVFDSTSAAQAPSPARALTPLSGHFSDESRPSTPLSGKYYCIAFVCISLSIQESQDFFFSLMLINISHATR